MLLTLRNHAEMEFSHKYTLIRLVAIITTCSAFEYYRMKMKRFECYCNAVEDITSGKCSKVFRQKERRIFPSDPVCIMCSQTD